MRDRQTPAATRNPLAAWRQPDTNTSTDTRSRAPPDPITMPNDQLFARVVALPRSRGEPASLAPSRSPQCQVSPGLIAGSHLDAMATVAGGRQRAPVAARVTRLDDAVHADDPR